MATPYTQHRLRARELRDRHRHTAELLTLYLALLDVWDRAWHARWPAARVLPDVVQATIEHGPRQLAAAVGTLAGDGTDLLAAWLAAEELAPAERYLARSATRVALEAVGAELLQPSSWDGEAHCPACGGPPQVSYRTAGDDPLVSGQRMLMCARCAAGWSFSATICPSCGESGGAKRTVYAEGQKGPRVGRVPSRVPSGGVSSNGAMFPHVRAEGCQSCQRYLIDIDLGRDPRAVPEVDELAALPLDLYVAEQGMSKITPNLMGF